MSYRTVFLLFVTLVVTFSAAHAQQVRTPEVAKRGVGFAVKAGTLGPGLEITKPITSRFGLRFGANYFSYTHGQTFTDEDLAVHVSGTLHLMSFSVLADWYPFKRYLRFSTGLLYNGNTAEVQAAPTTPYALNDDVTYAPEEMGDLKASLAFSRFAPYAGLGLGNAAIGSRLTLLLDIGVLYHGRPQFAMEGSGMVEPTAEQAPQIEANLATYRFYPVMALGFSVRI